jgi:hypothetical protein
MLIVKGRFTGIKHGPLFIGRHSPVLGSKRLVTSVYVLQLAGSDIGPLA